MLGSHKRVGGMGSWEFRAVAASGRISAEKPGPYTEGVGGGGGGRGERLPPPEILTLNFDLLLNAHRRMADAEEASFVLFSPMVLCALHDGSYLIGKGDDAKACYCQVSLQGNLRLRATVL